MEKQLNIDDMVNMITTLIPIPDNAGPQIEKTRIELILKLKDWQIDLHNFLKNPSFKNEKQKQGSITQINNQGNNIVN